MESYLFFPFIHTSDNPGYPPFISCKHLFLYGINHLRFKNHGENKKIMMGKIRRVVLDTLKPMTPTIIEMAKMLSLIEGVASVNISIVEIDLKVENAKITVEGENINYEKVEELIQDMGSSIHSIDEVVAGKEIIDDAETLQG